jgi:hypothetical protein
LVLVKADVDACARPAIFGVECQELNCSVAASGRLEHAREDDADLALRLTCDVAPGCRRYECFDGGRMGIDRIVFSPTVKLRNPDAAPFHQRECVDQRRQAEPEPAALDGDAEWNDHRAGARHGNSRANLSPY